MGPDCEALGEWTRGELVTLWRDLDEAIRSAVNGTWSIRASNIAVRIVQASRLVGVTPHEEVLWRLVASGTYEAVLAAGNLTPILPADEAEWQRLDALMTRHGSTREQLAEQLAATVAVIKSPQEQLWIATCDE